MNSSLSSRLMKSRVSHIYVRGLSICVLESPLHYFFKAVNAKINLECCKIGIKEYLINFIFAWIGSKKYWERIFMWKRSWY